MLMIRLQRVGRVNIPTFRVVLTDKKNSTKSGKFIEILGTFDPVNDKREIKADRVKHWVAQGAKVSDTVHNWLISEKIIPGKKVNALPKKKPIKKEEAKKDADVPAAKPVETAPAGEAPKA